VIAGALGENANRGLLVFDVADPAEVERFIDSDPYVSAGLVPAWKIEPWAVVTGD
jgi:uncharacterized protein YciI